MAQVRAGWVPADSSRAVASWHKASAESRTRSGKKTRRAGHLFPTTDEYGLFSSKVCLHAHGLCTDEYDVIRFRSPHTESVV